jgi:hypothetical protein
MQANNEHTKHSTQNATNPDMPQETPNYQHTEIAEMPSVTASVSMSVLDRIYDRGIPESPLNY